MNYYPYDSRNKLYRSHLGAVPANDSLRIRLLLHKDACVYDAFFRMVNDSDNTLFEIPMTPSEWLGDYRFFDCSLTLNQGLYWYDFRYTSAHGQFFVVKSEKVLGWYRKLKEIVFNLPCATIIFLLPIGLKAV